MKKLKRIWVLALLAAGFALALGCSNGSSGSGSGNGGGAGGSGGGQTSGGGSNGGGAGGSGGGAGSAKGKVIKGIGFGGDEGFTFADMVVTNVYTGLIEDAVDDEILGIPAQYYGYTYITLPEAIDVSSYEKVIISAKVSNGYTDKDDVVIFEFASGDIKVAGDKNFVHTADGVSGVTTWTDGSFLKPSEMESDFTSFTIGMEKFSNLKAEGNESSYEVTAVADMTNVTEFAVHPRNGSGTLYIQSIKFE